MKPFKAFFRTVVVSKSFAGVEVSLYASTALLLAGLAGLGPVFIPGAALWAAAMFAVLAAAGMAVHEGGHWLAARLNGIEVTSIEFKWFGALTRHDPVTTRKGLIWLSITGVVGNLIVAALCLAVAPFMPTALLAAVMTASATFNLMVAGFNILPALPMDGGLLLAASIAPKSRLEVGWARVRLINIAGIGVLMIVGLAHLDLMALLYAGAVLLHLWIAGEKPDPDIAEA